MNPELSFEERETTAFLEETLRGWGLEPVRRTPTGLWADLEGGGGSGPTVAVRADIDALPIHEANAFEFRSRRDGVMHACGHDGHTAILLGVTRTLLDLRDRLPGRVRLVFQPAEELLPGGARPMIEAGVLDGVDRIIGLHLWSLLPTGRAGIAPGPLMANADAFEIRVRGRGGHGAQPHLAADALAAAAQVVVSLQQVVSRMVDPMRAAVVTVGVFRAGSAFNVIAPEALLQGTVRTFDADVRARVREALSRVAGDVAHAFGCEAETDYREGYPALVNERGTVEVFRAAVAAQMGEAALVEPEPFMGGEDFAYYLLERPGAFLFLGARNPEVGAEYPHHHPNFTIDEAALPWGVAVLAATAWRLLEAPLAREG
ncbi:MAG: amidohydrolase [Clostridia bacterium]|nr:amidohydrolase [Clostridia bacterium]